MALVNGMNAGIVDVRPRRRVPERKYEGNCRPSAAAASYCALQGMPNWAFTTQIIIPRAKQASQFHNLPAAILETPMMSQELLSECCTMSPQA